MTEQKKVTSQVGRIDKAAAELFPNYSRSQLKQWILTGNLLVNGQKIKPKYRVKEEDLLELDRPAVQNIAVEPENIPLDIVYEDADVLVVNKPQGMVVHPAPGHPKHTLVNALLYHCPLSTINGEYRPGIVHRIDKDTSGLLMVAKNDLAHRNLALQLKHKSNVREYMALVHGRIKPDKGKIDAPLGRSPKDRKKQAVVAGGRHAVTHFEVLKRYRNYSLVKCILETGRTHQIRVHMKYIGHPLVGDPLYGPSKTIKGNGQFLHAGKLGFEHPVTHEKMIFEVPLPDVFAKTLKTLDKADAI
ncbi:ribosomal large subunit pseudouridine synthase D [Liquorilactobacillus sucicola DSM 21376 = JCM 15457]|uniref:Pseudouridine synthase n=2 Tax=Liquorilactobacillus sucicola TaxID=519050 RepID=A0A023CX98_9LACO|nr:RluA family pseudouridine synthase [Liquorilactobacillus sucicola]KRN06217.1 ribosomal large subunit pseudouridine synthase [Liquorilactobacillus sucicola DSM 21376 = JCM 15457]GAJ26150.1 ribosomal large subunit pseudouridine synthase D [Liquorilactobacillus sucicola DSM 21376 = JCM 15457]